MVPLAGLEPRPSPEQAGTVRVLSAMPPADWATGAMLGRLCAVLVGTDPGIRTPPFRDTAGRAATDTWSALLAPELAVLTGLEPAIFRLTSGCSRH